MEQHKRINGKKVLADIRSGMTEPELRAKYELSSRGLNTLFSRLTNAHLIDTSELFERYPSYKEALDGIGKRQDPRARLSVPVLVYDINSSAIGVVRDVSMTGLRVAGIKSHVGEMRTFQIPVDMFINADPLLVIAECCWVKSPENRRHSIAGFRILNLSQRDASVLKSFIEFLVLSQSGEWQTVA